MRFDRAVAYVIKKEGGSQLVDNPHDKGGLTRYGISQQAYPDVDILNLRLDQAREIYRRDYWNPIHGEDLPWPLALLTFDAAVMSGVKRAVRWLQLIVETTPDGVVGPKTINAAFDCDQSDAARSYTDLRISFLRTLDNFDVFGEGWIARCYDTLKEALS